MVAYRRGGPGELVQPGLTGELVPPDDVDALARLLSAEGAEDVDARDLREATPLHAAARAGAEWASMSTSRV